MARLSCCGALCLSIFLTVACAARQQTAESTPIELLRSGRYAELSRLLSDVSPRTVEDDALLALAALAMQPEDTTAGAQADRIYSTAEAVRSMQIATLLLAFSQYISEPPSGDFALLLCETALGSVGLGRLAAGHPINHLESAEYARMGVALIEQLNLQTAVLSGDFLPAERVVDVWNGAYLLLQEHLDRLSEYQAWRLYVCLAELSVRVRDEAGRGALADTFFNHFILLLKMYPVVAVAARCDLASPYEKVRASIATRRSLMGDLERAVAPGAGCTRGQYAPEP